MKQKWTLQKTVYIAVLAALVCVVTFFRFPLLGSKVHFANAMCLLSGLLMGPLSGGLAAGIGSVLYDALFGGYGPLDCAVTFVSKFLMAWVCAKIAFAMGSEAKRHGQNIAACVAGALTYVALYMLKTFIFQMFVYGYPMETAVVTMGSKLPASLINAVAAMVAAPILYAALVPALRRAGQLDKMRP
ncbi:ECF transporter S component [uncultured Dysosmobacter sp.]|uniref:ECF transporter S component n=1 Tax=uncultured Dysosmobacter sp. TaxID=2591384 RepID=UPI002614D5F7|nr:ECF transporter S component [uncultured Dysosmobacter sp.]